MLTGLLLSGCLRLACCITLVLMLEMGSNQFITRIMSTYRYSWVGSELPRSGQGVEFVETVCVGVS